MTKLKNKILKRYKTFVNLLKLIFCFADGFLKPGPFYITIIKTLITLWFHEAKLVGQHSTKQIWNSIKWAPLSHSPKEYWKNLYAAN